MAAIDPVDPPPAFTKENFPTDGYQFQLLSFEGFDLAAKDVGGTSDPYLLIGFIGENDVALDKKKSGNDVGGVFYKSPVHKKCLSFKCEIKNDVLDLKPFKIEIWDKDTLSADDWMGSYVVKPDVLIDAWIKMDIGKSWKSINDLNVDMHKVNVEQGVKSGKVKGCFTLKVKLTHKKIDEYAKQDVDYLIYQNKCRQAEKDAEEKRKLEEKKKQEEEKRLRKEAAEKQKQENKEKHKTEIAGQFEVVDSSETFKKFLSTHTSLGKNWGAAWHSGVSILSKKEVVEVVTEKEIFRILSFVLEEDASNDLLEPTLYFVKGMMTSVDFSNFPDALPLVMKLFGWYKALSEQQQEKYNDSVECIRAHFVKKLGENDDLKTIKVHMDCKIFNEEEQEIIKGGIKPTYNYDGDEEPLSRFSRIIFNHLGDWKPEHAKLLLDIIKYLLGKARRNMEKSDFWDAVGRFCIRLENAKHEGIDKVMASNDGFLLVDGIGVNFRVLHIFKKELSPLKRIYNPKSPPFPQGRWYFIGCRGYTRGGWQYIKEED